MRRRSFFRQLGGLGAATLAPPFEGSLAAAPPSARGPLGLHPFVEAHPEAVFIRRTKVAAKTDAEAIRREAHALFREVFELRNGQGDPERAGRGDQAEPHVDEEDRPDARDRDRPLRGRGPRGRASKEHGVPAGSIFVREGLMVEQPTTGYSEMATRAGVHYGDDHARTPLTVECPDGVVFRRTPLPRPVRDARQLPRERREAQDPLDGPDALREEPAGDERAAAHPLLRGNQPGDRRRLPARRAGARRRALRAAPQGGACRGGTRPRARGWRCGRSARSTTTRSSSRPSACT